jgi:hypothetical protein
MRNHADQRLRGHVREALPLQAAVRRGHHLRVDAADYDGWIGDVVELQCGLMALLLQKRQIVLRLIEYMRLTLAMQDVTGQFELLPPPPPTQPQSPLSPPSPSPGMAVTMPARASSKIEENMVALLLGFEQIAN